MDSPLQKSPLGLLGALDLKTLGHNPDAFGGLVAPVTEALSFYSVNFRADRRITGSTFPLSLTVPTGQLWRVWNVSAVIDLSGATITPAVVRASIGWLNTGTGFTYQIADLRIPTTSVLATDELFVERQFEIPFLAQPGAVLALNSNLAVSAGSISASLSVGVDQLAV